MATDDLYKFASPSVVTIEAYGDDGKLSARASGFIVTADGEILTNYHVIAHTKLAVIRLANGDAYDTVSVLDVDKGKDIALLKIKAIGLPSLQPGHSGELHVGDKLYALANPPGASPKTLSEGALSAVKEADGYELLQISAPISPENSGSPVFDTRGGLVGIAEAASFQGQNLNLAIPIEYAAAMLLSHHDARSLAAIYEPAPTPPVSPKAPPAKTPGPSAELKSDATSYLAQKLGLWTKQDGDKELGEPFARRDGAFQSTVFAVIYKYKSPTADYSAIELSFDRKTGKLRAAYLYPQGTLNWEAIRAKMGRHYTKSKAHNGAASYDYQVMQHTVSYYVNSSNDLISIGIW